MTARINIITFITIVSASFLNCTMIQSGPDKGLRTLFEGGEIIPSDATKIYIRQFSSHSNKNFNIIELMNRLKRSLKIDGRLNVIDNDKDAEIILTGEVRAYTIQPVKFNTQRIPEIKRMRLTIALTLYNSNTGKTVFQNRIIEAMYEFSDITSPVETEFRAELNLIDKIIPDIISKIFTGWHTEKFDSGTQRKQ